MLKKKYDVCYIVKEAKKNPELLYSLRSLKYIEHLVNNVYIFGYTPSFVDNVISVESVPPKYLSKNKQAGINFRKILNTKQVSNEFIFMHDDFFIVDKLNSIPDYRMKSLTHYIQRRDQNGYHSKLSEGARETRQFLRILLGPKNEYYSYETHTPIIINKKMMQASIDIQKNLRPDISIVHRRTIYGNLYKIEAKEIEDVKIIDRDTAKPNHPHFLSTSDEAFESGAIGSYIRDKFNKPYKYEK